MTVLNESAIIVNRQAGQASRTRPVQGQRANVVLSGFLVGVVALAPIPLGSNRPFFWAMWAGLLGLAAAVYLLAMLIAREPLRFAVARLWLPLLLVLTVAGFMVAQMLPLSADGFAFATAAGERIVGPTLSLMPGGTWLALLQVATFALFFFLMLQVAVNRMRARTLGIVILAVITVHATYGLVALTMLGDPLLLFEKQAHLGFATGTFVNRNSFATFLAMGLVLGVVMTLREALSAEQRASRRPGAAAVHLAATGVILAALVATGSRMGLLAGLAGAAVVTLMALRKRRPDHAGTRWLLIGLLPLIAIGAVLVLYGAGTMERLGSLENDATVRGDLYLQVIDMIAARPWLGYGGGAFEVAYPLFHQLPVSADLVWDKAHSSYLTLWAELGLAVGSIPILILAILLIEALVLYLRRRADWAAPSIAVGAMLVGAIHSLVDFSLEIEANMFLLLALVAIGIARPRQAETADS